MPEATTIRTGVDRLVNLISVKKKISIKDAAKELSVPPVVIEEWVDFLHEKGVIDVEYHLTTPFLVMKELTPEESEKKEKEFHARREGFMRKVQSTLNLIESETAGLQSIKEEFKQLSAEVDLDVRRVRDDLATLEKYEKLKMNLDKEILSQQHALKAESEKVEKQIREKQSEYSDLVTQINKEELLLDEEIRKTALLKENETILRNRLAKMEELIQQLEKEDTQESERINLTQQKLAQLKQLADKVRSIISIRGTDIQPLIEKNKEHEKKIMETQQQILDKITQKKGEIKASIEETRRVKEQFETFFQNKVDVDEVMDKINIDLERLKTELRTLIEEARVLQVTSKSKKVKEYADELEEKFKKIEQRRGQFEKDILNIGSLLRKKSRTQAR